MKEIPLTQGYVALVDDEDYGRVSLYKWYAHKDPSSDPNRPLIYAQRSSRRPDGKRFTLLMHRFILGDSGPDIDHWDRNGLNNQRGNLRACNQSQNNANGRMGKHSTQRSTGS
jgi:hypothetical protein